MSDLRGFGSLEQDADMVMLLYRKDYYNGPLVKTTSANFIVNGFPPNSDFGCIPSHRRVKGPRSRLRQQVALTGCRGPVTLALLRGANVRF